MNIATAAALASLLIVSPVAAQVAPRTPIVLKAAHMFDGKSGSLVDNALLVVQNGRIQAVGGAAPAGMRVIDLGNVTLLPGFIDAHVHLNAEMEKAYDSGFDRSTSAVPVEDAALFAKRTLEAGFTTVRSVGAVDFGDIGLAHSIAAGVAVGPRILTAGHAIGGAGGVCDDRPYPSDRVEPSGPIVGVCTGPEECRAAVQQQLNWSADLIKICMSGSVLSESDGVEPPRLTAVELSAIVTEAHTWKRKVAAHCHSDLAARQAIEAGVDSIEHGTFLTQSTLQSMKEKGVYLVPTRLPLYWTNIEAGGYPPVIATKARAAARAHAAMFKTALRVGVPIAFGTDSGVSSHGQSAKEFALMVELGMTPKAALLSATREAAKLLGVAAFVGTLEAGKVADIVAVPGNPLTHISATERPVFVMHHGTIVVGVGAR